MGGLHFLWCYSCFNSEATDVLPASTQESVCGKPEQKECPGTNQFPPPSSCDDVREFFVSKTQTLHDAYFAEITLTATVSKMEEEIGESLRIIANL
jgi:hypothetical protein